MTEPNLSNVRATIRDWIVPLLPADWRFWEYGVDLSAEQQRVNVMLTLKSVARHAPAPRSHRQVTYLLTVVTPLVPGKDGEQAVDDDLFTLLEAIDALPSLAWTDAERVIAQNHPAYDVTLTTIITNTKGA